MKLFFGEYMWMSENDFYYMTFIYNTYFYWTSLEHVLPMYFFFGYDFKKFCFNFCCQPKLTILDIILRLKKRYPRYFDVHRSDTLYAFRREVLFRKYISYSRWEPNKATICILKFVHLLGWFPGESLVCLRV